MLTHDYRTTLLVSLGQLDHPLGETVNKNSRFLETSMTHPDYRSLSVSFRKTLGNTKKWIELDQGDTHLSHPDPPLMDLDYPVP